MQFASSHLIPPVIRRFRWWYIAVSLWPLASLAVMWYQVSRFKPPLARPFPLWFPLITPICMFATIIVLRILEQRIVRRARGVNFAACTNCTYPLQGEKGICPECGAEYRLEVEVARWSSVSGLGAWTGWR